MSQSPEQSPVAFALNTFGTALIAVGGKQAGDVVAYQLNARIVLIRLAIFALGLTCVVVGYSWPQVKPPIWTRSRKWALNEIERLKDPFHPLHKPYWAESLGYKGISDAEHDRALAQVHSLYEKAYLGRFRREKRTH